MKNHVRSQSEWNSDRAHARVSMPRRVVRACSSRSRQRLPASVPARNSTVSACVGRAQMDVHVGGRQPGGFLGPFDQTQGVLAEVFAETGVRQVPAARSKR